MKWRGNRQSSNVEDRRGAGFGVGGKSIGLGTVLVAFVLSYFLGVSPTTVLGLLAGGDPGASQPQAEQTGPIADEAGQFVATVLADTEDTWSALFQAEGSRYVPPTLVLFSDRTPTACGTGQSATGPFYCPADQRIYIDLSFYRLMRERFGVTGEFAHAYVIAHEVGHHVQQLTGVSGRVAQAQRRASQAQAQANALSVRQELQADCFAGLWAHHADRARSILEGGDVEAALNAASAIGDDALQREAGGTVVPDSFTHGSSAQRVRWFKRGLESGEVAQCDTFAAQEL